MNPILAREIRARFRDRRSFWLLFSLTTLLCMAAGEIYGNAYSLEVFRTGNMVSVVQRASEIGRELFGSLVMMNAVAWLLVAPALTATGLSQERERGLLESLWLSPFRVRSQILGRYAASLLFLLLLQLTALPIYGIAMLLGGVSPGEVLLCGLIIALAAILGAALGLWCSARAYRPMSALGSALGFVAVWTLATFYGPSLSSSIFFYLGWSGIRDWLQFSTISHPLVFLMWVTQASNQLSLAFPFANSVGFYSVGFGVPLLFTFFLLAGATRAASKPLPERAWIGRHPYLERWKSRLAAQKRERETRREAAQMSEKVSGALLYEVPFEKLARFKDPLLQREVRGRFRLRQGGFATASMRLGALFIAVVVWLGMIGSLFDPKSRGDVGLALGCLLWGLGALTVGVLSSSSLTRERESGTWEGLHLSLLRPGEITRSKWLSPLITFLYWSAPLSLWLPLSVQWKEGAPGMPFWSFLGVFLLAAASLGAVSALGLFISSRTKRSAAATSWTLFSIVALFTLLPMVVEGSDAKLWFSSIIWGTDSANDDLHDYYYGYSQSTDKSSQSAIDWTRTSALLDTYSPILTAKNLTFDVRYLPLDNSTKFLIWLLSTGETALFTLILLHQVKRNLQKTEK